MMSISPNSIARSSLEEMLDSLRRRDGSEKPKDVPPALPARPKPTSRARLPSAKRRLPSTFEAAEGQGDLNHIARKNNAKGRRRNSFGSKQIKEMLESPYVLVTSADRKHEPTAEEKDSTKLASSPQGSLPRFRDSECGDNLDYFIKKKLRVWCQRHNRLWESGQLQSTSGKKASVLLSDNKVVTVPTQELLPANPDILEGVDDLVQLSYLNEPSVLHNLQYRFSRDIIYSKAGPLLIAVNPFKDVQLCGNDLITAYRKKLLDNPHVFAVVDTAYNEMMTEDINQSIIISGEIGAGKTETAKVAMQYLAAIGGCSSGIESEVLQTSCVLEAFGNAKTSKNDNSSRFGKLIEIQFTAMGKICGAKIQTSLLEKSRVVQLARGDRSYHIFYQLCAGAPSGLRDRLRLKRARDYNYLKRSDCLEIQGVNDVQKFQMLMGALNTVRISEEDQDHAFEMLAAVLWLGNISFHVVDSEKHVQVVNDEAVTNAAELIGCSEQELMVAFSNCGIHAGKDDLAKRPTLQQAMDTRDSLAKFIYSSLFDWLVEVINVSLARGKRYTGRSISILDIYGFESIKKNSFEQFCINYANERLQQHFNRHLFKIKQEEYEIDGIDWTKIDFEDNQECLDLFEKKPIGLISLLDEESDFPKATELTFVAKLKQQLNSNNCFKGEIDGAFSVHHYAGEVLYDTREFLEKNRDVLHSEVIQLLSSSTKTLPKLFAATVQQSWKSAKSSIELGMSACKQTVATKFKGQLFKLMQQLESTMPHFILCVKPNGSKIPGVFEKDIVLEQLRCCGVLEVVWISRSGYPTRMAHQEFTRRYGFLLPENNCCQDPLSTSVAILQQFDILPGMYQVGYTKLYFRDGQLAALEDVRKQVLQGTLEVQKCFRGHRARRYFHEVKGGVVTLQSFVRGEIARKEYSAFLSLKKHCACKNLNEQLPAVVQIQSAIRGWLVRKHFRCLHDSEHSNVGRRRRGRRISEAKDLPPEMLPAVVEELQKQVVMAEATIGQKEKENTALRERVQQYEAQWSEYEAKMKSMEDMWQKQMASLQMNLAAAKKSLGTDNNAGQPRTHDAEHSPQFYDSDDTSMRVQTPGSGTPSGFVNNGMEAVASRNTNGKLNAIGPLVKEFEQRKQNFDNEALAIVEVKSGHSASVNPVEDLRKLKERFNVWKKDYKARLREAKAKARWLGHPLSEKHRRKWWGKKIKL